MLEAVGVAVEVPERLINVQTGLSGSGPAYGFQMIEAMSDGAGPRVCRGIRHAAGGANVTGRGKNGVGNRRTPWQTQGHGDQPGTTIEGLHEMEAAGVRNGLMNAVRAAADKASSLANKRWLFPAL